MKLYFKPRSKFAPTLLSRRSFLRLSTSSLATLVGSRAYSQDNERLGLLAQQDFENEVRTYLNHGERSRITLGLTSYRSSLLTTRLVETILTTAEAPGQMFSTVAIADNFINANLPQYDRTPMDAFQDAVQLYVDSGPEEQFRSLLYFLNSGPNFFFRPVSEQASILDFLPESIDINTTDLGPALRLQSSAIPTFDEQRQAVRSFSAVELLALDIPSSNDAVKRLLLGSDWLSDRTYSEAWSARTGGIEEFSTFRRMGLQPLTYLSRTLYRDLEQQRAERIDRGEGTDDIDEKIAQIDRYFVALGEPLELARQSGVDQSLSEQQVQEFKTRFARLQTAANEVAQLVGYEKEISSLFSQTSLILDVTLSHYQGPLAMIGAYSRLFRTAFGGGGSPSVNPLILLSKQIVALRREVQQLRREMHERFDLIETALEVISDQIEENRRILAEEFESIGRRFDDIEEILIDNYKARLNASWIAAQDRTVFFNEKFLNGLVIGDQDPDLGRARDEVRSALNQIRAEYLQIGSQESGLSHAILCGSSDGLSRMALDALGNARTGEYETNLKNALVSGDHNGISGTLGAVTSALTSSIEPIGVSELGADELNRYRNLPISLTNDSLVFPPNADYAGTPLDALRIGQRLYDITSQITESDLKENEYRLILSSITPAVRIHNLTNSSAGLELLLCGYVSTLREVQWDVNDLFYNAFARSFRRLDQLLDIYFDQTATFGFSGTQEQADPFQTEASPPLAIEPPPPPPRIGHPLSNLNALLHYCYPKCTEWPFVQLPMGELNRIERQQIECWRARPKYAIRSMTRIFAQALYSWALALEENGLDDKVAVSPRSYLQSLSFPRQRKDEVNNAISEVRIDIPDTIFQNDPTDGERIIISA